MVFAKNVLTINHWRIHWHLKSSLKLKSLKKHKIIERTPEINPKILNTDWFFQTKSLKLKKSLKFIQEFIEIRKIHWNSNKIIEIHKIIEEFIEIQKNHWNPNRWNTDQHNWNKTLTHTHRKYWKLLSKNKSKNQFIEVCIEIRGRKIIKIHDFTLSSQGFRDNILAENHWRIHWTSKKSLKFKSLKNDRRNKHGKRTFRHLFRN